ncbi:hypothetical protein WICMUC_004089 [Wickerhamomyces mucosus]|uniref:Major facilitator superfamily (MFS) profile domain-containing protein n=1 Tax=Wickerhamomyces mucosus TaxID=1378264 RepID=A0A9P8PKA7_9ASCO|nr:hypothetical protein WICMUC_004089 [Wickerhamomyces mucosus]
MIEIPNRQETLSEHSQPKTEILFPILTFKQKLGLFFSAASPPKQPKAKFFWWNPPGQTKREKKLLFKLDAFILTYVCLSYYSKYLDQANISSAYVSSVLLHGAEYNWINNLFTIGFGFGGLLNLFNTIISPNIVLPVCEICWGIMCLVLYKANSFRYLMGIRFAQGVFEGIAWPACHYILGTWYNKNELARRASLFTASGMVGSAFSGYFQVAVYKNLSGVHGIAGWRWLFIIDFIVTIPIALLGFAVLIPSNAEKTWWLNKEDLTFARERMKFHGIKPNDKWDKKAFKRILTSWQFYFFPAAWVLWDLSGQSGGIVTCLVTGFIIDITGKRWHSFAGLMCFWIIGLVLLVVWEIPRGALFLALVFVCVSTPISPLLVGWANQLTQEDVQLRAATISVMNLLSSLVQIPWSVKLFNVSYAPRYKKAFRWCLGLNCALALSVPLIVLFDRYQNRKRGMYKLQTTYSDGIITVEDFIVPTDEFNEENSDEIRSVENITENLTIEKLRSPEKL